ncbi:hypothetical protein F4604DRAFT_1791144 [Suillus subluteus]|nr:hypothetical protein F4604DRAFT_1791144 [Suillus subluteus]
MTIDICVVFGVQRSTHPADVQSSSTLADITGDLTCVPEHVGIESTICLEYFSYRVYSDSSFGIFITMTGCWSLFRCYPGTT